MDFNIRNFASFQKLVVADKPIYVKLCWISSMQNDCLFDIKIYDGNNVWSGTFNATKNFNEIQVDESLEEYKNNIRIGLSENINKHIFNFEYLSSQAAKFSWKKVFEDSVKMPYGFVEVQLENQPQETLIDALLEENKDLKNLIEVYDRQNNVLTENLEKCKNDLEEFVHMKTSLENSLYGKFVQLLNEKKKRIQLLEESIQKFE